MSEEMEDIFGPGEPGEVKPSAVLRLIVNRSRTKFNQISN
jgi:hypothetical protein